jgi:hypothetical protein
MWQKAPSFQAIGVHCSGLRCLYPGQELALAAMKRLEVLGATLKAAFGGSLFGTK